MNEVMGVGHYTITDETDFTISLSTYQESIKVDSEQPNEGEGLSKIIKISATTNLGKAIVPDYLEVDGVRVTDISSWTTEEPFEYILFIDDKNGKLTGNTIKFECGYNNTIDQAFYTWEKIIDDTSKRITSVTNSFMVINKGSKDYIGAGHPPVDSELWSSTEPDLINGYYHWTKTVTTYVIDEPSTTYSAYLITNNENKSIFQIKLYQRSSRTLTDEDLPKGEFEYGYWRGFKEPYLSPTSRDGWSLSRDEESDMPLYSTTATIQYSGGTSKIFIPVDAWGTPHREQLPSERIYRLYSDVSKPIDISQVSEVPEKNDGTFYDYIGEAITTSDTRPQLSSDLWHWTKYTGDGVTYDIMVDPGRVTVNMANAITTYALICTGYIAKGTAAPVRLWGDCQFEIFMDGIQINEQGEPTTNKIHNSSGQIIINFHDYPDVARRFKDAKNILINMFSHTSNGSGTLLKSINIPVEVDPSAIIEWKVASDNAGVRNLLEKTDDPLEILHFYSGASEANQVRTYTGSASYPDQIVNIEDARNAAQKFGVYIDSGVITSGETYTFSAEIAPFGNNITLGVNSANGTFYESNADYDRDWKTRKMSYTFVAGNAYNTGVKLVIEASAPTNGNIAANSFQVCHIKLEKGSIATPWDANPAETYSRIRQTAESIELEVSKKIPGGNLLLGTSETIKAVNIVDKNDLALTIGAQIGVWETEENYPNKWLRVFTKDTYKDLYKIYIPYSNFKVGEKYTFSVDVKNNYSTIKLVTDGAEKDYGVWYNEPYDNNYRRLSLVFTALHATQWLEVVAIRENSTQEIGVRKFKLEEGERGEGSTNWNEGAEEISSSIRQTSDSISLAVNSIKIGGTNLIRLENDINAYVHAEKRVDQSLIGNSYYKSGTTLVLHRPQNDSSIISFRYPTINGTIEKPGQYMLSFYVWSVGENNLTFYTDLFEQYQGDHYYYFSEHKATTDVVRYELPITHTSGQHSVEVRFHTDRMWSNPDAYICITDVKFEEGTKATTWSANTDDVRHELSAKIEIVDGKISSKADAVTVTNLGQQVTTAEGNIDAIKGEISNKVSTDVFDELGRRVSTAESEISQTPEKIEAKVSGIKIGGTNILRLENPNNGFLYAEKRVDPSLVGKTFYKSGTTLVLKRPPVGSSIVNFVNTPLMGTPDKPGLYMLSFYAWAVGESGLNFYTDIFEWYEGDHYYYFADHTATTDVVKFELPITYTGGQRNLQVRFHTNHVWGNPDAYICITDVKLEEGTKATDWSDNNGEFRAGSAVKLTSEEVVISTPEFTVDLPGANDLHMDKDGAAMGNLNVTGVFNAPNVAYSAPVRTYEVGIGMKYSTLEQVFAELNCCVLMGDVNIWIGSTIYGHPELKGTCGTGSINIHGQEQTMIGSLMIRDCSNDINIADFTIKSDNPATPVYTWNCSLFRATNCNFDGQNLTNESIALQATKAYLLNVGLYNSEWHLHASLMSQVVCNSLKGGDWSKWWCYAAESVLTFYGTIPQGYTNLVGCIYTPADYLNQPVDPGTNPTPQPSVTTVPLSPTDYRTNYNTSSWQSKQSQLYQGIYGSDAYRAVYWFSNSGLSGKTVKSATITLTRVSGSGSGAATSVHLWGTPLASASGNPTTNRVDYGEIGTLTYGETKEFSIPLTAAQAFASGSIKGFIIDPNDSVVGSRGYSANYGKLESASTLKITY